MNHHEDTAMHNATWVLLRGLTRESGHWGDFPSTLRAALPAGCRLVSIDLPGNGTLNHLSSPTRVPDMAKQVRQQLHALGLPPPYHVVAMSLGAMVTVAWAHAHPTELAACVLVNTSLRPHSPFWHRLRPRQWPRIAGLLWRNAPAAEWENAILQMTTRHPPQASLLLAHWLALRAAHPVSTRNGLRQLWAATRYRAPLAPPPVPILLLSSQSDQLVNPACSQALARHWACALHTHPSAGHDLPQDDGSWVATHIGEWVNQAQAKGK